MKKMIICLIIATLFLPILAFAEIDYSSLSDEDLFLSLKQVEAEIYSRTYNQDDILFDDETFEILLRDSPNLHEPTATMNE